jgi:hemolysin III
LIAGTYTPFLLIYLNDTFGITLLFILWTLTLLGIIFKIFFTGRFEIVSLIIYVAMGWILVSGGRRFFNALPHDVLTFLIIGGGLYSAGIFFYVSDRYKWNHAIWHLLVLVAAICHYIAVLLAV